MGRRVRGRQIGGKNVEAKGLSVLDAVEKKLDGLLERAVDVVGDVLKGENIGRTRAYVALELIKSRVPQRNFGDGSANIQLVLNVPRPESGNGEIIDVDDEERKPLSAGSDS